ncbi:MAG: hypothetical protein KIS92_16205 [Planctomycetota bacterium]|nr:hypothetical protein [Planctomycetota bacterium]
MKRLAAAIALVAVFCAAASIRAAAEEEVVLTYKDGKTETGTVVSQDFEKVVLQVKVGGNKMEMKIPWEKIKELSNGMTYELMQKKWREANKDKLCEVCQGVRKVSCVTCNATGILAKNLADCKTCAATGLVPCTAKGCNQGKVECPGKCLKLSKGKWVKGKEDLLWQTFTSGGSYMMWSERHLGEVIEWQKDHWENVGKCPLCNGTTKVDCEDCKGAGKTTCGACKGAKQVPVGVAPKCPDCQAGKRDCQACKGTGLKQ